MSSSLDRLVAALADRYRIERELGWRRDGEPPISGCDVNLTPPHRFRRVGHVCQRTTPSGLPQRHAPTRLGHGSQRTATSGLPQQQNPTGWGHFHVLPPRRFMGGTQLHPERLMGGETRI
jgi:hypothetical protein